MASSLRFTITSAFNAVGFDKAASTLVTLVKGTALATAGLAKLALTGRGLGVLIFVELAAQAVKVARAIGQMVPDAAQAESSINRLTIQLELLGVASEGSIDSINKFARESAAATRFTADGVRAAVAESVRRTGDIEGSLRRVSIAQDIAAVTGQSLQRTIRQVALAEQGRVRSLQLITDLSRQELVTAARRGEVLEVLEERFEGAAEAEANSLEGLERRLDSINRNTRRTLGSLSLPFRRFTTGIELRFAQAGNAIARFTQETLTFANTRSFFNSLSEANDLIVNIAQSAVRSGDALTALREGLTEAFAPDAVSGGRTRATEEEVSVAAESATLALGQDNEERRRLARERERINTLLELAEQDFRVLNQEQVALLRSRATSSRRLNETIIAQEEERIEAQLNANNVIRQAQQREATFRQTGNVGRDPREDQRVIADQLRRNGFTEEQITRELTKQSEQRREIFELATQISNADAESLRASQREQANLGVIRQSFTDQLADQARTVLEDISAIITPSLNVNFNIEPDILRGNIIAITESAVRNFLQRLRASEGNAQRQQDINANIE